MSSSARKSRSNIEHGSSIQNDQLEALDRQKKPKKCYLQRLAKKLLIFYSPFSHCQLVLHVIRLLTKQEMAGCLRNLYKSVESLGEEYIQPNQNKDILLKPKVPICPKDVQLLMLDNTTPTGAKRFYMCNKDISSGYLYNHMYVTDKQGTVYPVCSRAMSTEMTYVGGDGGTGKAKGVSHDVKGGFVKGVVTYMVIYDLFVKPMSTISSITLLNQFNVKDVGSLEEKVGSFRYV